MFDRIGGVGDRGKLRNSPERIAHTARQSTSLSHDRRSFPAICQSESALRDYPKKPWRLSFGSRPSEVSHLSQKNPAIFHQIHLSKSITATTSNRLVFATAIFWEMSSLFDSHSSHQSHAIHSPPIPRCFRATLSPILVHHLLHHPLVFRRQMVPRIRFLATRQRLPPQFRHAFRMLQQIVQLAA